MPYSFPIVDRRSFRAQQLLAHVLHQIEPWLRNHPNPDASREVARELRELFLVAGAQIITDADRAAAGLPPRDQYGWTLEELVIYEAYMREEMLAKFKSPMVMMVEPDGTPVVERKP